jgi:arsenate reductase
VTARALPRVLFVCVQNAGRSQMAQALWEMRGGAARSAGSRPAQRVHPEVVAVMRELGVDLAARVPRALTTDDAQWADVVVTMGCGDACPYVPGRRYLDWELADPAGLGVDEVRAVRDEIRRRIDELATSAS